MARAHAFVVLVVAGVVAAQDAAVDAAEAKLEPLQCWSLQVEADTLRWIDDVVTFRGMFPPLPLAEPPTVDLTRHAVLCVPARLPDGQRLEWQGAAQRDGEWHVALRAAVPSPEAMPIEAKGQPVRGAMFLLPRVRGPVRVHLPIVAGAEWPPLLPPDPAAGQCPKVLALLELELDPGTGPDDRAARVTAVRCERATTPAEWRRMRDSLGDRGKALPDDYADFAQHCVVLVQPPRGRAGPRMALQVATEEGVDVVSLLQSLPSGRRRPAIAPAVLLTLPRRAHQLAVVFGTSHGSAPDEQATVGTFAPLR